MAVTLALAACGVNYVFHLLIVLDKITIIAMGMTYHLGFASPQRFGGVLAAAGVLFALGFAVGATVRPVQPLQRTAAIKPAVATTPDAEPTPAAANPPPFHAQLAYPAEVVRVIDGDTFQARVRVWPGLDVDTKVRLRDIDAPELHARCAEELAKAQAARAALETMLAAGGVTISRVGLDKYGGRVDAAVSTRDTADVSAALLNGGWARAYDGGRRGSWC
jgi:endonuclease YncB( thermonuclease family)